MLAGCGNKLVMRMDNARLSDGYINSKTLDFGSILLWDINNSSLMRIYTITNNENRNFELIEGNRYRQRNTSVSRNTQIDVLADNETLKKIPNSVIVKAKSQFVEATRVRIENYYPLSYRDPRYVLNSPELRRWRESIVEDIGRENLNKYRFVFIGAVIQGAKLHISTERSTHGSSSANVINIGRYKFDLMYDNNTSYEIEAKTKVPLLIKPTVFKLVVRRGGNRGYEEIRFVYDTDMTRRFNLQKVKSQ